MDDRLKESLSALMDDEASELELRRLLAHPDYREVRETWQRYHAERQVIVGDDRLASMDISAGVMAAIEASDEIKPRERVELSPQTTQERGRHGSIWWRTAVAASVFFVVGLISLQQTQTADIPAIASQPVESSATGETTAVAEKSEANSSASEAAIESRQVATSQSAPFTEEQAHRLNEYLLRHAEQSSNAGSGVIPFARLASFSSEEGQSQTNE